jgi:hypothetical protein
MRLRLMGTRADCAATVAVLRTCLRVLEVSEFYPNRGGSELGRVYVQVRTPDPMPEVSQR